MRLTNLIILLIFIVSYATGQNSNVSNRADAGGSPLPTPTIVPANTTVRGKVFYEDDKTPVRRSVILVFNFEDRSDSSTLTDEKGNFELKNVKAGSYYPLVLAPGAINFFSNIDFSKVNENEKTSFAEAAKSAPEFKANGTTDLNVEVPVKRGGSISGKVFYADGSPAIGCSIQIFRRLDGKLQPVISDFTRLYLTTALSTSSFQTDDRGMYRFAGLPDGEYFISVSESAFHTKNTKVSPFRVTLDYAMSLLFGGNSFLNTFYPNTIESKNAQPLKVEAGREITDANITIPDWKLFNVSGKVVSAKDGKPVKARVYAMETNSAIVKIPLPSYSSEPSKTAVQTDENGNWAFYNIPRGNYTILVDPVDENNQYLAMRAVNAAMAAANAVSNSTTVINTNRRTARASSNELANFAVNSNTGIIPKPRYAKISYDVVVANSDVENISIKADPEAVIKGTADFDVQTELNGAVIIQILNEMNVPVGTKYLYLYDSSKYLGKIWKQNFTINSLPKGKLKMKIIISNDNISLKSATLNNIDLQQNVFEIGAGQTLDNFKLIFVAKKKVAM